MPKVAIARVAWSVQDSTYQVHEKIARGATIPHIEIESQAWQEWLALVPSFAFLSKDGHRFTARKEARARGSIYWVAYRKVGGRLTHTYIGRSEDVTLARLEQVAAFLTEQDGHLASNLLVGEQQARQESPVENRWQDHYLTTKFIVPAAPHTLIARPRLFSLLEEGRRRPLTLVSAPAGFGKTTLLSAWVQAHPPGKPPVAWVSLEEADNDPVRFWGYVLTVLERVRPGNYSEFAAYLRAEAQPSLQSVITACLNRLSEQPEPLILVLDDYHLLTDEALHTSLAAFIEHLPPQVRVILSTRADPPLPLTRLRGRGQLLEVRVDQLRTTPQEARAFLREVMHIDLPEQELAAVEERTEGWLVGLQLVGLSLQGRRSSTSSHDLLEEVSGQQGYILDYLTEEVLSRHEPSVQRFLLHTSVLERLSAPLCDALLGRSDSQQVLEALQRANLFVVPLDSQRRWYRYHTLFAEALRTRLEQAESTSVRELHLRASQWYAGQGDLAGAVQHALSAPDWQRAADLIEQQGPPYEWASETYHRMHSWLQSLPEEVVRARPRLCLFAGYSLLNRASPQVLDGWLIQAEAALAASRSGEGSQQERRASDGPAEQDDLLGEILAERALLAPFRGDAQAALPLCEQALLLLAEHNHAARQRVTYARALALGALGEMVPTHAYVQLSAYEQSRVRPWAAIGHLAEVAIHAIWQAGRLHEAWGLLEQALGLSSAGSALSYPETSDVYAWRALVLREWNRLDEARDCAQQAVQIAEQLGVPMYRLSAHGSLLRVTLSRGELQQARVALDRAETAAREVNSPYIQAFFITVEQVRFLLASGDLERAALFAERLRRQEQPLVPLAREREAVALARVWLAQGRPDEVLSLLTPLLETATRQERWGNVIELRLLAALAYQARNEEQQALTTLAEAVRLAQPEGYIRSFVDEGGAMATLLSKLRDQQRKQGPTPYLDTLLAAFPPALLQEREADHPALRQPSLDPLSTRELEVLHLLAQGASNQEIAEELVVTLDTVKRHVSNILSKLAASNRTQAVSQARELGLLSAERHPPFDGHTHPG